MNIVILFSIILLNGDLYTHIDTFDTLTECNKAIPAAIQDAVNNGATDGSFTCTEYPVGKIS